MEYSGVCPDEEVGDLNLTYCMLDVKYDACEDYFYYCDISLTYEGMDYEGTCEEIMEWFELEDYDWSDANSTDDYECGVFDDAGQCPDFIMDQVDFDYCEYVAQYDTCADEEIYCYVNASIGGVVAEGTCDELME
jgi:hypothetical protein